MHRSFKLQDASRDGSARLLLLLLMLFDKVHALDDNTAGLGEYTDDLTDLIPVFLSAAHHPYAISFFDNLFHLTLLISSGYSTSGAKETIFM